MTKIACGARAQLGNVILGALVLVCLSACGADDAASSISPSSASTVSVISPRAGLIDREPVTKSLSGSSSTPPTAALTPSGSGSGTTGSSGSGAGGGTTGSSGSGSSGSGSTTGGNSGGGTKIPPPSPAPSTGSATLDWLPPTQNSDGSALTNLAGYTVYYGNSPDQLTHTVKLANPGLTAFIVSNLTPGTWYFAVTSYTAAGVESARTGVVRTTI